MALGIGDLARNVLEAVERGQVEKIASTTYNSMRTDTGRLMLKVAEELRNHKPAPISYADLATFRNRYGI